MESYFYVAEQFQTQAEPTYCGLATLAMILNALRVDPMRNWKGSWRWFTEENLGCGCITPKSVQEGMTMQVLASLADCNGAATDVMYAPRASHDSEEAKEFADLFRASVQETCSSGKRQFLIASYSRGYLGQTGDGHFSPIGGYHEESDSVLIMDVARFKYPSHWAPLKDLASAMLIPDSETGKPRGFIRLCTHPKTQTQKSSAPQKPLEVRYLPNAAGQWIAGSLLEKLAEDQRTFHNFHSWSMLALSRWLSAVEATSPEILGSIVAVDDMDLFMGMVQQIYSRSELFRTLCGAYVELQALGFTEAFPSLRIHGYKLEDCQMLLDAPQTCGELWILFLLLLPQHMRAAVSEHLAHPDLSTEICNMVEYPWALPMEALKQTLQFALPANQAAPELLWSSQVA
jgi:glutathione gamma-glutamylcysteinyltransferase